MMILEDRKDRMLGPCPKIIALSIVLIGAALPERGGADEMALRPLPQAAEAGIPSTRTSSAVTVTLDFARIMTFDFPARTIVIGNPAIVDGTLSDATTIVLTGKNVGTTNMIVLGEAGQELANLVVHVTANSAQQTIVHRGEAQQSYTCAGQCRPVTPSAASK